MTATQDLIERLEERNHGPDCKEAADRLREQEQEIARLTERARMPLLGRIREETDRAERAEAERDVLKNVTLDMHKKLGVEWGKDVFLRIEQLLSAEAERDALRAELERHVQDAERWQAVHELDGDQIDAFVVAHWINPEALNAMIDAARTKLEKT